MYLYEVWVAAATYHKAEPLLYQHGEELQPGAIVEVSLKSAVALGFVSKRSTAKPRFTVKTIERAFDLVLPDTLIQLHRWILEYYPSPSGPLTQLFMPRSLLKKTPEFSESTTMPPQYELPPLSEEQQAAITQIGKQKSGSVLLHGDTGTGKTRVYIELAKQAVSSGKSAIVLTPEIGLTPQLTQSFTEVFGEQVITTHSHLTEAQRRDIWLRIAAGKGPWVVVGPRSALFLPLKKVGFIAIDEAHDSSYKQEQAPYYLATRVAAKLAALHGIICVFGTATPLLADYYLLKKSNVPIIRMTQPVKPNVKSPTTVVVDRHNKEEFTRSWLFSNTLIDAIAATHAAGKSSLIFLNRRGTARVVLCKNCGWQASCPHCELPLAFHHDEHQLRCHICGYTGEVPMSCPSCHQAEISLQSAGTKALEQELQHLFPGLSTKRFDSDVTKEDSLAQQYHALLEKKTDLIIGTQVIAKGLDLPNLGLVGIPFADTSLYLPDFTAMEQTFQILTQVTGRVGRTDQETKIVIQSFNPNQPAITAALTKNWDLFYNEQLKERSLLSYPPFWYLLQLTYSGKQEKTIKTAADKLVKELVRYPDVQVVGPAPRFHRKTRGVYSWQLIVKAKNRQLLTQIISELPSGWRYNLDPLNLL